MSLDYNYNINCFVGWEDIYCIRKINNWSLDTVTNQIFGYVGGGSCGNYARGNYGRGNYGRGNYGRGNYFGNTTSCSGGGCAFRVRNVMIAFIRGHIIVRIGPHYYGLLLGTIDPHYIDQKDCYMDYLRFRGGVCFQ